MHSKKAFFAVFLFALLFAGGCTSGPQADEILYNSYKVGMTRAEVHTLLAGYMQVASLDRPAEGWKDVSNREHGAILFAQYYERNHAGSKVASVEVYSVPRATSSPYIPMALGIWYDYFLFDSEGKVLEFRRRFID